MVLFQNRRELIMAESEEIDGGEEWKALAEGKGTGYLREWEEVGVDGKSEFLTEDPHTGFT